MSAMLGGRRRDAEGIRCGSESSTDFVGLRSSKADNKVKSSQLPLIKCDYAEHDSFGKRIGYKFGRLKKEYGQSYFHTAQ